MMTKYEPYKAFNPLFRHSLLTIFCVTPIEGTRLRCQIAFLDGDNICVKMTFRCMTLSPAVSEAVLNICIQSLHEKVRVKRVHTPP